jgi:hypothetical protein
LQNQIAKATFATKRETAENYPVVFFSHEYAAWRVFKPYIPTKIREIIRQEAELWNVSV